MDAETTSKSDPQLFVWRTVGNADFQPLTSNAEAERSSRWRIWGVLLQHDMATGGCSCLLKCSLRALPEADMPHVCSNTHRDRHSGLQTVVISDPHLMDDLLHDTRLYKPAEPDYINFRKVGMSLQPCSISKPFPHTVCPHKHTHTTKSQAESCT